MGGTNLRKLSAYCKSIKLFSFNNANDLEFSHFSFTNNCPSLLPLCPLLTSLCGAKLRALTCYRRQRREEGTHLIPYYTCSNDTSNYAPIKLPLTHRWLHATLYISAGANSAMYSTRNSDSLGTSP